MKREYELCFVIMEHGFMGTHIALQHLEEALLTEFHREHERRQGKRGTEVNHENGSFASLSSSSIYGSSSTHSPLPRELIVLNHEGNDGKKCYPGIEKCAERLVSFVLDEVTKAVKSHQANAAEEEEGMLTTYGVPSSPTAEAVGSLGINPLIQKPISKVTSSLGLGFSSLNADPSGSGYSQIRSAWTLRFHVLGYSLGGLIVRAALPALAAGLHKRYMEGGLEHEYHIVWETFFSLCSPHIGSSVGHPMIHSTYRLAGCLASVCLLPRVVEDMMLKNDYVENVLLSPSYLEALRRFNRRIFIALKNDRMVWNYSSAFFLPPIERRLLDGWTPENPVFNPSALQSHCSYAAGAVGHHQRSASQTSQVSDGGADEPWAVPVDSSPFSNLQSESDFGGATEEDTTTGGFASGPSSEKVPWLLYTPEEKEIQRATVSLHSTLSLQPATSLRELLENAVLIHQNQCDSSATNKRDQTKRTEAIPYSSPKNQGKILTTHHVKHTLVVDNWITEDSWPSTYLPHERNMAIAFLQGVGPLELHLVDLEQMVSNYVDDVLRCSEPGAPHDVEVIKDLFTATITRGHQLVLYPGSSRSSTHRPSKAKEGSGQCGGSCSTATGRDKSSGERVDSPDVKMEERMEGGEEDRLGTDEEDNRHVNPFGFVVNFLVSKILSFSISHAGSNGGNGRQQGQSSHNPHGSVANSMANRRAESRESPSTVVASRPIAITTANHITLTAARHAPAPVTNQDTRGGSRVLVSDESKAKKLGPPLPSSRQKMARSAQPAKKASNRNEVPVIAIPRLTPRRENRRTYHRKMKITVQKDNAELRDDTKSDLVIPLC